jgi:hypothetical protein
MRIKFYADLTTFRQTTFQCFEHLRNMYALLVIMKDIFVQNGDPHSKVRSVNSMVYALLHQHVLSYHINKVAI